MPDIPEEAVQTAAEALSALSDHPPVYWQIEARAALEAAMPVLEQHFRQDLSEWLMRVGKRTLKDARNPVVPDPAGRGWAEAFIAAGILVDGGYPRKRGDADA